MLVRIFNSKNFVLQFFLIAIVFAAAFYFPISIIPNNGFNPLYNSLLLLIGDSSIISRLVFALLIALPILITQYFSTLFGIIPRNHFHFVFLAPLLIFTTSLSWSITPILIAFLFYVIGVVNLFQLNRIDNPIVLSSTAFIFSISSLFYSLFIWNFLLIIIALFIFREFNLRELIMVIGSFILPYIYIFTWFFINDELLLMWNKFVEQLFSFSVHLTTEHTYLQYAFGVFILLFSIYLIFSIITSLRNKLINIREYLEFMILAFFFALILLIFSGENSSYHYFIILYFIAFFYSISLSDSTRKWIHEVIVMLFVIQYIFNFYIMLNA